MLSHAALCHIFVVNACVQSTTGYMEDAIDVEEADDHEISDEAKAHLSIAHVETINRLRDDGLRHRRCPQPVPSARWEAAAEWSRR